MSGEKDTGRLEAFSDGVIAIAITLLALDLPRPEHQMLTNTTLWFKLIDAWPSFLTFFISFGAVLTMWVNHHRIFELIHQINRPLLFANGFLLMLIVTVPFVTALLTEHLKTPAINTATAVYAAAFTLINIAYVILWHVASHGRALIKPGVTEQTVLRIHKALLRGVPAYILAFILSFFNAHIALALLTGLWMYWALQRRRGDK